MWEIGVLLLLIALLAVFLAPRVIRRRPGGDAVIGTLVVTGLSPRPEATGEQYVTITGVINGPTVSDYTVYQRLTVDVDKWPAIGQEFPVLYSQKNPDNWSFAPAQPPEPPTG